MLGHSPISLADYLRTSFHPDGDFGDGEVVARNLGEFDHAAVQALLTSWLFRHRQERGLRVLPEIRIRVSETRVRIADVCLVSRNQPVDQALSQPPLAVIEILSPEDRNSRYKERLGDHRPIEIASIWVIDQSTRVGYDGGTPAWISVEDFRIAGTSIILPLSELWRELDASR